MRYYFVLWTVVSLSLLRCSSDTMNEIPLLPVDELDVTTALPDPLVSMEGEPVETVETWTSKRVPEIQRLFAHYMYGYMPPPVDIQAVVEDVDPHFLEDTAIKKHVTLSFKNDAAPSISVLLVIPKDRPDPSPVFLGLNFYGNHSVLDDRDIPLSTKWLPDRGAGVVENLATEEARGTSKARWNITEVVGQGYAVATLYHGDIDPDKNDFTDGMHAAIPVDGLTERTDGSWGALSAWAWGLHRVVDYLITDPDIDPDRIAVMGHSRNGKAALWAGATDPRIGLVISNQSGCGGAALSRRKMGETVEAINTRFPHWFNRRFHQFNEDEDRLPLDQHMLIALIAPRPVLIASAVEDDWADPEGEFLALKAAEPVYKLFGLAGLNNESVLPDTNRLIGAEMGYHLRPGGHGIGPEDWNAFVHFANQQWGNPNNDS